MSVVVGVIASIACEELPTYLGYDAAQKILMKTPLRASVG